MDAVCGRGKFTNGLSLMTEPLTKKISDIKYLRKEISLYLIRNMTKIWLDHIQWSISLIITNINNDNYTEESGKKILYK